MCVGIPTAVISKYLPNFFEWLKIFHQDKLFQSYVVIINYFRKFLKINFSYTSSSPPPISRQPALVFGVR